MMNQSNANLEDIKWIELFNYVFYYSPYESLWYAIDRDTYLDFFNGNRQNSVHIKSNRIEVLIEYLTRINKGNLKIENEQ